MGFTKKRGQRPKNRQTKTILVWDEKSRIDYLTGFRKRKAERKKYHQEKLKKRMIEERKDLKKQAREMMKKKMNQHKVSAVPEVDHLVDATEFDLPNHTVTITDITDVDFSSEGGLRLGQNLVSGEDENEADTKKNKYGKADERRLVKLKRKLQKCGSNDKKRKSKVSFSKHHSRDKLKEKRKFKKRKK